MTTRDSQEHTSFGPLSWRVVRESFAPATDAIPDLRQAYQYTVAGRHYREDHLIWRILITAARAHGATSRLTDHAAQPGRP